MDTYNNKNYVHEADIGDGGENVDDELLIEFQRIHIYAIMAISSSRRKIGKTCTDVLSPDSVFPLTEKKKASMARRLP